MYTDKHYYVKDRLKDDEEIKDGSIRILYRNKATVGEKRSSLPDTGLYPNTDVNDIKTIIHCPPGLEILADLTKMYLIRRIEMVQNDPLSDYKAEIVNEKGQRLFKITNATRFASDEVIHYGKLRRMKMKGKICYGVLNFAGREVFEIYGDPEKIIRVGPNSALWGEIQVMPGPLWQDIPLWYCCCCCNAKRKALEEEQAEIRIVVLRKHLGENNGPSDTTPATLKHVYTVRGKLYQGCCHLPDSVLYKKSFDLRIYDTDTLPQLFDQANLDTTAPEEEKVQKKKKKPRLKSIGRICSSEPHKALNCNLPILELPQGMDIYEKITLMGTLFLFDLA